MTYAVAKNRSCFLLNIYSCANKHNCLSLLWKCDQRKRLRPNVRCLFTRATCVQAVASISASLLPWQLSKYILFSSRQWETEDWNTPTALPLLSWHSSSHQDGAGACYLKEHGLHVGCEICLWQITDGRHQLSVNSAHWHEYLSSAYSMCLVSPDESPQTVAHILYSLIFLTCCDSKKSYHIWQLWQNLILYKAKDCNALGVLIKWTEVDILS